MNKKFLIAVCIMLAVLTIGSVSASDDISDDGNLTASSGDEAISSSVEDVQLEADDTNDVVVGEDEPISDYDYEVHVKDTYMENDEYMYVWGELPEDAEGYVYVDVDNEGITSCSVWDGHFGVYLMDYLTLSRGTHFLKLNYTGDGTYQGFVWNKTFTVDKVLVDFPDEIQAGSDYDYEGTYLIRTISQIDGNITIYFDGEEYKSGSFDDLIDDDSWDEATAYHVPTSIDHLSFGPHTYNVTYWIDGEKTTKTGVFNVSYKFYVSFDYFDEDMPYGTNDTITVSLPNDVNGNLTLTVNGRQKQYPASKRVEIPLENLVMGINNITVTYGDAQYPLKSKDFEVNVIGKITCSSEYVTFNTDETISLVLPEDATGQLCIYKMIDELTEELVRNVTLSNGKAVYTIDLGLGSTSVLARYENGNYNVNEARFDIYVVPNIEYPKSAVLGSDVNFTIEVPDGSTGDISVRVYNSDRECWYEDEDLCAELYNGAIQNLSLALNTTKEGYYAVKVSCDSYSYSYLFHVMDANPEWEMIVDFPKEILSTDYYVYPHVNYPKGGVGKFTIYIDGKKAGSETIDPYDGLIEFYGDITNHTLGVHTWRIEYTDDPVFNDASQNGTFNITWAIFPEVVVLGEDSNIVQVGIMGYDGEVTLKINNELYRETETESGLLEIYLEDGFVPGSGNTYEITAGDLTKTGTFDVDYSIGISVDDGEDDDYIRLRESNELGIFMPSGATGTVNITVGDSTYTGDVDENGEVRIPINLKWGVNSVIVTYYGNDAFPSKTVIKNFTVSECEVLVQEEDGKLISASLLAPEFATGNLTVSINWDDFKTVKVENGYATLGLDDLPVGCYHVSVSYEGEYEFYVYPYSHYVSVAPDMNITEKIIEGQDCIVEIALPDSTSTLDLYVDGELNQTYTFEEGKLKIVLSDLTLGNHILTLNYNGGDYANPFKYFDEDEWEYYPIAYNVEVCEEIVPVDPDFVISIANVEEGTPITVEVTANENFTDDVIVKVGDIDVLVSVTDGSGVNVTDIVLSAGNDYMATLAFDGNDAFNPGRAETKFNVTERTRYDANLNVSAADVYRGQDVLVSVSINETATGNVTISINGNDEIIQIIGGKGNYTISDLQPGDYNYTVSYTGDEYFLGDSKTVSFNVAAYNVKIEIINDVNEFKNGNFTFKVISNIDGSALNNATLMLTVKGEVINAGFTAKTDENGIATFKTASLFRYVFGENLDILALEVGKHAIELEISGNGLFAEKVTSNLTITPAHVTIVMDNYEEFYGSDKNLTFTVTNVNGEVLPDSVFKLEIPGTSSGTYYVSTDENGTSQVSVRQLYRGTYDIKISNNDTENICNVSFTGNFTVKGLDAGFSVNASDVYVGENATVTVKIDKGFAGVIAIDVDGESKFIDIVNGEGKYVFANLNAGDYAFNVTYGGDLRYDEGMDTVSFKVNRQSPDFTINIADVQEEVPVTVEVTANANFTGDVVVKIGNNNVTVSVKDGNGTNTTLIDLPVAENYTATLTFDGNDAFKPGSAETTFSVFEKPIIVKIDPLLTIFVDNITEGESSVVVITTHSAFTGDVLIQIGQRNITVNVTDGRGSQTVGDLPAATYTAIAVFSETAGFLESIKNTTFIVNAKGSGDKNTTPSGNDTNKTVPAKIIASDLTAYYSLAKYSVTVYGTDGKHAKGVTVTFKIDGKKIGTAKTNKDGVATIKLKQTPKTYKITSEALGAKQTKTLKIKKVLTLKKIKVKKSTTKLVLKATLKAGNKAIKAKKVTFKVNGKKVGTVKTNNKGLAQLKIKNKLLKKIKKSKKVKYQVTYLKVTVKKSAKVQK